MNIVFLTRYYPEDINNWSGILYYVYHKLKERHRVEIIGPEILKQLSQFRAGNVSSNTFSHPYWYVNSLGRLLSERINACECDLLFFGDLLFIPTDINIPFVLLSDMTYEQVRIYYVKHEESETKHYISLEASVLGTACKIIHSSEWTKQKAIEFYHIDPAKIEVVEFGANIPEPHNYTLDIDMSICRLLFIGKNWERKNGSMVLQIYRLLKKDGFPCTLTIIGSEPDVYSEDNDDDLTVIPFFDKNVPDDLLRLKKILSESHFFVLPTKFDAFGIVFCEASAFALPSIAADVGGVGQAVREGKNGFLLPAEATAADYAEKIITVFDDPAYYLKLRRSSRDEYEKRLNWDVWGERVNKIFEDAVRDFKQL